ncbi:glutamate--cysteine ligase [Ideonella livida]|uniref:Glutamate--cysteine ligase n=1 Tax=Ideonella livida TaxID=2707176 RepID=A0A7C9TMG1_9BURK|nr:glutamate--cysteine ligase [Ideonella livida]NDY93302.1 glutamate--cysteine ligase [Ideonella livida]
MTLSLHQQLPLLRRERLQGVRRGIEKESLRARPDGALAFTPHPLALGAALTHPHITTDFSESQLELVTGAHTSVEAALAELTALHQVVARGLGEEERMWVSSMPCRLPADADIPLGQYGRSHIGQAKTVYRRGLGHRYGRRMQTISGIHYNWSIPGASDADYFGLIRNFRRHSFLLLYLFGASPAVGACFVAGLPHGLQPLGAHTLHLPHATSLRMGRLGYQSDAQASLRVSYNGLEGYGASLEDAMTRVYPPYEAVGLRDEGGRWQQLSTTLLQIENEFYGTIRPKRTIRPGERPLHALRQRGVEYVEVRCMDLDPFCPTGISEETARFLDVFLLHCLLAESPPETPEEIAALGRNQHRTAGYGREPGLLLERDGMSQPLRDWAAELLADCARIAAVVDEALQSGEAHQQAVARAQAALAAPEGLPSSRVLAETRELHGGEHLRFGRARSEATRQVCLAAPLAPPQQAHWARLATESLTAQARIEAQQTGSFEEFLDGYLAVQGLRP